MRFYLIDDDPNVLYILNMIIEERELGQVCGQAESAEEALGELSRLAPDIVIVDLLMPKTDGISFVLLARPLLPGGVFIMLSQVSSKEMVASAYEAGVEFFIQKPINSVEVETVVKKVSQNLMLRRAVSQLQSFIPSPPPVQGHDRAAQPPAAPDMRMQRLQEILRRLGIIGDSGSRDITALVSYMWEHEPECQSLSLSQLCARVSDSPKTLEQRVRRTAFSGLVNLASLGLEDYLNETFTEYAGTLYNFEQVRREMDFIRGKSTQRGKVQVRLFLNALASLCQSGEK